MSAQTAVNERERLLRAAGDATELQAAFVFAAEPLLQSTALGHVDESGDIYDYADRKVGHVTARIDEAGEIYRGYDDDVGRVLVARNGDGYVYSQTDREDLLRGVVTARGDVFEGRFGHKVGVISPALDAERMGAAALLLGLL